MQLKKFQARNSPQSKKGGGGSSEQPKLDGPVTSPSLTGVSVFILTLHSISSVVDIPLSLPICFPQTEPVVVPDPLPPPQPKNAR